MQFLMETWTEGAIHAYVDGHASEGERRAVQRMMARDPRVAERVAAYRAQTLNLNRMLPPSQDEPVARLRDWFRQWLAERHPVAAAD